MHGLADAKRRTLCSNFSTEIIVCFSFFFSVSFGHEFLRCTQFGFVFEFAKKRMLLLVK